MIPHFHVDENLPYSCCVYMQHICTMMYKSCHMDNTFKVYNFLSVDFWSALKYSYGLTYLQHVPYSTY